MLVKWVSVDSTPLPVSHGRLLLPTMKQTPVKRFKYNVVAHNQIYNCNLILFEPKFSKIWHYLNRVIPDKCLTNHVAHILARLLSAMMSIDLPREVYRRNKALWFWLEQNYNAILEVFQEYRISIRIGKCIYVLS